MNLLEAISKFARAASILQLVFAIYHGIMGDDAKMWTCIIFAYINMGALVYVYGEKP